VPAEVFEEALDELFDVSFAIELSGSYVNFTAKKSPDRHGDRDDWDGATKQLKR
jgi:hypothetical protein